MRKLTRDTAVTAGLTAAVLVSLVIVRGTASEPAPTPLPRLTEAAAPTLPAELPVTTATRPPPAGGTATTGSTPATAASAPPPVATLVLSSGAPVHPRPGPAPSARPASTAPVTDAPTAPPAKVTPQVFQDPAEVAAAWLAAMCWYDYRTGRDDNTRRAAAYGDTAMPPGQDPWTFDEAAWAQITQTRTTSGCADITSSVDIASGSADGQTDDQEAVTLTATQVLSTAGAAYQSVRIELTRMLKRDPAGHWRIGPPVTAN